MKINSYRHGLQRRQVSRRRLLRLTGGGLALTGLGSAGCARPSAKPLTPASQSGSSAANQAPRPGGTYRMTGSHSVILDPHAGSAGQLDETGGAVFSRLFRFKAGLDPAVAANHDLESDLALSAESPDAVTWTVKLRSGATFHNIPPVTGHAVEAEDVKATFARAIASTRNPNRGQLGMIDIDQIQTPDARTVVFRLRYPYAPFQQILASPTYSWVLPREALAGAYDPSKVVIGSGPFLLSNYTPDVALEFKKNPDWFEKGRPYVDAARYAIISDKAQQLAQFMASNLDQIEVEPNDQQEMQRRNPKALVVHELTVDPNPLYFQLGDPQSPFQDVRVRRAFSMALDRDTLGKAVFNGQYEKLVFLPLTLGKWALKVDDLDASTQQYYKYDPAGAKKLLDAAGASNLDLKFTYVVNGPFSTPSYVALAQAVANMLSNIGVKLTLVQQDHIKEFNAAGKGSRSGFFPSDMVIFGSLTVYSDADEYLYAYFASKSTSPQERLSDSTLDSMIAQERAAVNADDRLKRVKDIQRYVADKMYVVTACGERRTMMVQPRVRNYQFGSSHAFLTETVSSAWLST